MPNITITFVRHGESEDNLKSIWAGWKDAPLSALGEKQAAAVGRFFSTTKINIIYASPSLRAHSTGLAIQRGQPTERTPPLIVNPKLREQHFGIAEGQPFIFGTFSKSEREAMYETGVYPIIHDPTEKFPEGESLQDLGKRAEEAIAECVLPHVGDEVDGYHIVLASHGLAISQLVAALLRLDPTAPGDKSYAGLLNTAWTRAVVSVEDGYEASSGAPLSVKITDVNASGHLHDLIEPTESNASEAEEEKKAFFGGGRASV